MEKNSGACDKGLVEVNVEATDDNWSSDDDDYLPIEEPQSDSSLSDDFSDSSVDEELIETRKIRKSMRSKCASGFQFIDDLVVSNQVYSKTLVPSNYNVLQATEVGYLSAYESSSGDDQLTPPASDEDDVFAYRRRKKEEKLDAYDPTCNHKDFVFKAGMKFTTGEQFRHAVQLYGIENGRDLKWVRSTSKAMEAKCVKGCGWRVYASKMQMEQTFQVKKVEAEHTCGRSLTNRQASRAWLGETFLHKFRNNPNWPIKEMQDSVNERFALTVTLQLCYKARSLALSMLRGSLYTHYAKLRSYILELKRVDNEGTFCFEPLEGGHCEFRRFYVGFSVLRNGFLQNCRRVFGLDGAFLKTFLGGCLLTAVGRDPNDQMYPIAWAVVDSENGENWRWFMDLLTRDLGIIDGNSWTVISDQQKGLENAVSDLMPNCEHRNCSRHIYANWKKRHNGEEFKKLFWSAVNATNLVDYKYILETLKGVDEIAFEDFIKIGPSKFCKTFFRTNLKCDASTNNMSEAFNGSICKARAKPLIDMLEDIRSYLMERMYRKSQMMESVPDVICPRIRQKLEKIKLQVGASRIVPAVGDLFQVRFGENTYVVNLKNHTCSCGAWDVTGIPCNHAVASIAFMREDPADYVNDCFKKQTHIATYSKGLEPLNGSRMWPISEGYDVRPPPYKKMPGRPKQKRRKVAGEEKQNSNKISKLGVQMKCQKCYGYGHNRRSCKNSASQNSNSTTNNGHSDVQESLRATKGTENCTASDSSDVQASASASATSFGNGAGNANAHASASGRGFSGHSAHASASGRGFSGHSAHASASGRGFSGHSAHASASGRGFSGHSAHASASGRGFSSHSAHASASGNCYAYASASAVGMATASAHASGSAMANAHASASQSTLLPTTIRNVRPPKHKVRVASTSKKTTSVGPSNSTSISASTKASIAKSALNSGSVSTSKKTVKHTISSLKKRKFNHEGSSTT